MLGVFTKITIILCAIDNTLLCAQALSPNVDFTDVAKGEPARFDIEARLAKDGYWAESHDVVTADGYILEINRIPNGRFKNGTIPPRSKPVVFLMHGLQSSALSYIHAGPGVCIAYTLADAGYDVWMGNARGVVNSRRHVSLDPDKPSDKRKFFDYSFDDIGDKDLPAMLDYILKYTKKKQLNYIGHSQGGTAFLVLNSRRPEYNKIFMSAHLLAAIGYQRNFPNRALKIEAEKTDSIYAVALRIGYVEVGSLLNNGSFESNPEHDTDNNQDLEDFRSIKPSVGVVQNGIPTEIFAGASTKQYAHYGQNIRDEQFRRWNYGPLGNLFAYGRLTPPAYDLRLINVDVTMHYTVGDTILDERDVLNMASAMPDTKVRRVRRDNFTHVDFIIAADSKELVTDYIVEELNKKNN